MRKIQSLISLSLLPAFAGMLYLSGQTQSEHYFFLQMSDPQFGMYTKNRDFSQETANYEFAIATANRLKPRFVIVSVIW